MPIFICLSVLTVAVHVVVKRLKPERQQRVMAVIEEFTAMTTVMSRAATAADASRQAMQTLSAKPTVVVVAKNEITE